MSKDKIQFNPSKLVPNKITIGGFKHLTVALIHAVIAVPNCKIILQNVPNIADTKILIQILKYFNCRQVDFSNNTLKLNTMEMENKPVPLELSQQIHGALYMLPVLLGRFNSVKIGQCGGCEIGEDSFIGKRPIDHVLQVLEKFGAIFTKKEGWLYGCCEGYHPTEIDIFDFSTNLGEINGPYVSGATKTAILASLFVDSGKTVIKNIYPKPDVLELLAFIKLLPYEVSIDGGNVSIQKLKSRQQMTHDIKSEIIFTIIADVSEIMTWYCFSHFHNLPLNLMKVDSRAMQALTPELTLLAEMGLNHQYYPKLRCLLIIPEEDKTVHSKNVTICSTGIYSDHQPFICLLLTKSQQVSVIQDTVWHKRFQYVKQLNKLGFDLLNINNTVQINPGISVTQRTSKNTLAAADLRSAAVLVIACVGTKNSVTGISHLARGYENFEQKLKTLGVEYVYC